MFSLHMAFFLEGIPYGLSWTIMNNYRLIDYYEDTFIFLNIDSY